MIALENNYMHCKSNKKYIYLCIEKTTKYVQLTIKYVTK